MVTALAAERVPLTAVKLMVSPLTTLLFASVTVALMALVLAPSAERLSGVASTVTVFTAPAIKVTVVLAFTPPHVAVTVAEPRMDGLVSVTVATPLMVVAVAAESVAAVVLKLTVVPSATLLPLVSFTVAEINVVEVPSATILELPALTATVATDAATSVIASEPVLALVDVAVTVSLPAA